MGINWHGWRTTDDGHTLNLSFYLKWCYSQEVDLFPFLAPHWILVVTFVCTVIIVHGSFPFWTLLCGVYRPYGFIFCHQLYNHSVTAICLAKPLVSNLPVSYEWDIKDCVLFGCCCAWWGFYYFMVCFVNRQCCIVNECINVSRFNWIGHVYFRGEHHLLMDAFIAGYCFGDS